MSDRDHSQWAARAVLTVHLADAALGDYLHEYVVARMIVAGLLPDSSDADADEAIRDVERTLQAVAARLNIALDPPPELAGA